MKREPVPPCAKVASLNPVLADRMWNTTTDDDGRDLIDERMRGKGRMLCAACPMRLDCLSRALACGWKDKAVYGGLDYRRRWSLARVIATDLRIPVAGLHELKASKLKTWLREHPDWTIRMQVSDKTYSADWHQNRKARRAAAAEGKDAPFKRTIHMAPMIPHHMIQPPRGKAVQGTLF